MGNYKPASLIFVPGEMVEILLKDKILKQRTTLLRENQHDFCKGKLLFEKVNMLIDVGPLRTGRIGSKMTGVLQYK